MLAEKIKARFGAEILSAQNERDEETFTIEREHAYDLFRALRDEPDFEFNFLTDRDCCRLARAQAALRGRLSAQLADPRSSHPRQDRSRRAEPWVHSVVGVWGAADWLERECFDMFGIDFKGHPDLRRILMYDSFDGHPLRKDYLYNKRQPIVPEIDPVTNPIRQSR